MPRIRWIKPPAPDSEGARTNGEQGADQEPLLRGYRKAMEYFYVGIVFPVAVVIGFLAGRWIGGWFGQPALGAVIGLLFGAMAAFYNLFQTLKRLDPTPKAAKSGAGGDQATPGERVEHAADDES